MNYAKPQGESIWGSHSETAEEVVKHYFTPITEAVQSIFFFKLVE